MPARDSDSRQDGRPVLVLIHGLFSSPQEFGLINHSFRLAGIESILLNVDGYTNGNLRGISSWQDWLKAASQALDALVSKDRKVVLGGLCVGGILAGCLALDRKAQTGGLIMLSPTFDYDGWGQSWWRHFRHAAYALKLDRFIQISEREPFGIKNERIRRRVIGELKARSQSAIGPARLPLWAIHESEKMMAHVRGNLERIQCQTLVIHSREDELSALPGVERIFGSIGSEDKRLLVLENSYHMVTMDNDRERVATEIANFVRGVTPDSVSAAG